jgi:hypothetical protein
MAGIKETLEFLESVEVLVVEGKKIAKDGVSLADIPEALELFKKLDVIIAGGKDADKIYKEELKELDQSELIQIGAKVFEVINAFKAA